MARHRHHPALSARTIRRGKRLRGRQAPPPVLHKRLRRADRKSLLLGTALASTLLIAVMTAPAAAAVCPQDPPTHPCSPKLT